MESSTSEQKYKERIQNLCAAFLGDEWAQDKASIVIQRILTGCVNKTFRCTLNGVMKKDVIVKIYGSEQLERAKEFLGKDFEKHGEESPFNGEASEIVVVDRLSSRGMAPKLYGVFSGGRIEEFIEGRNPSVKDFEDKTLFASVARNLAKYHCMEMPVRKKPEWVQKIARMIPIVPSPKDYSIFPEEHRLAVQQLYEMDLESEFDWTFKLEPKINSKIVFSHNDLHFLNMILKDKYESNDERIMFVDYEGSSYSYRGYDFAYFMTIFEFTVFGGVEKVEFNYTGKKLDEQTKRYFIEQYFSAIKELRKLDSETDTVEHMLKEIDFFQLQVYLAFTFFTRGALADPGRKNPCTQVQHLLDCYQKHKQYFLSKYQQFK